MKYEELIEQIQKGYLDDYYTELLLHAEEILDAYWTRDQEQLGRDLLLNKTEVAFLLKLLIAYSDLRDGE